MSSATEPVIHGYHAHVYYDASTQATARAVCEKAARLFKLQMGRMHTQPVGPHPDWSCQLAFATDVFAQIIPWLMVHREGLVIFAHPETGDQLGDHRDRALWMGAMRPLDLSVLS